MTDREYSQYSWDSVMTVQRKQTELIDAALPEVLRTVRSVLATGKPSYRYEDTIESEEGREIATIIRPHQAMMLSTKLRIRLYAFEAKTKVVIETKSQWFLFGDIADYYGGYIRDLFESLRSGDNQDIGTAAIHDQASGKAPVKLFVFINILFVLVLFIKNYLFRIYFGGSSPAGQPGSMDRIHSLIRVEAISSFAIILSMMGFNYWWRKRYFNVLDPKQQKSMETGRNLGRLNLILIAVIGIIFFFILRALDF
jgi:hypothetical protein